MTTLTRNSAQSLSTVALFAAVMAVLGLVPKIDLPFGVPITLQSLGVMLAGCLLGGKRGFQSLALFLLAVAVGMLTPLMAVRICPRSLVGMLPCIRSRSIRSSRAPASLASANSRV